MSAEAYINIAFQAFGGILSLMIILFLLFLKRGTSRLDRLYIRFLSCNTLVLFSNAATWVLNGKPGVVAWLGALISNFCVFALSYLLFGLFTDYVTAFLSARGANCKKVSRIVWGFCIALMASTVLSQFNHMYYVVDAQNFYYRQSLFWVSQVVPMISTIPLFWALLHHRKLLSGKELAAFLSYLALPIVALMIQIFTYGVVYFHLATTFVSICIYIFIQSEQERKLSEQALELERSRTAIMLSQIQPHFLYNSLLSIKLLCDTNPPRASEALEHFSFYLRGNLDALVNMQLVSFEKELVHIKDYLFLEKMRFADELTIAWDLQCKNFMLPPLTVQPLIENAIRHGLNKKSGGGTLTIKSERTDTHVIITLHDDGVGFEVSAPCTDGRAHVGIENTRSRLAALCGGSLLLESEKGVGTTATILLPQREAIM